jgi:phosphopantothenoylcysteine decarboxylase/phosphopantothenate--cysteine ligase
LSAHTPSSFRVLLLICGGIAAYKTLFLIRGLRKRGALVRCVLTRSAQEFITPLSVASLSGDKVYTDLFSLTDESEMGHIELSRQADLVLVAPATANMLAKMTHGIADDLVSTILMATDKPVFAIPSMNVRMWEHAATQRNIRQLVQDGIRFLGPVEGDMACGEFGYGRMVEPESIMEVVQRFRAKKSSLVLIVGSIPKNEEEVDTHFSEEGERLDVLWTLLSSLGIFVQIWGGVGVEHISLPMIRIRDEDEVTSRLKSMEDVQVISIAQWVREVPNGIHDLRGEKEMHARILSLVRTNV